MINNTNNFQGESKQVNINIVIVNNYHSPSPVVDQPTQTLKKKSEFWKTKFLPLVYSIVKWSYKFGGIFFF